MCTVYPMTFALSACDNVSVVPNHRTLMIHCDWCKTLYRMSHLVVWRTWLCHRCIQTTRTKIMIHYDRCIVSEDVSASLKCLRWSKWQELNWYCIMIDVWYLYIVSDDLSALSGCDDVSDISKWLTKRIMHCDWYTCVRCLYSTDLMTSLLCPVVTISAVSKRLRT